MENNNYNSYFNNLATGVIDYANNIDWLKLIDESSTLFINNYVIDTFE